jgi:hypothetical protein
MANSLLSPVAATQVRGRRIHRAASETAELIDARLLAARSVLQKSALSGVEQVIRGELADVFEECRQPNWDGYDALPLDEDSFENAVRFLRALPLGTRLPSIGAEPDGHVTLEWHRAPRRTLSVSVAPGELLHYAALLGPARTCGSESFYGEVPKRILDLIRDVYA